MTRLLCSALAALALAACASLDTISEGEDANLMLRGADPVGYFTVGLAMPGKREFRAEHGGVTYRFANETNRRLFITRPDRYVPQFGGFCANGMAYALPIPGDTGSFKIIDGRLYLFSSRSAKQFFEMDQERNLRLARHYWESEAKDSSWRLQSWKRMLFRVPHYKSNRELAEEYQRRFGRAPG
ncbi:MAG: YHS domain-containing (seleno)protein [Pseudomonadota bacterium]